MFSSLLLKISADGTCMEAIDQVVVRPFLKGATDAVQVRWGAGTPLTLDSGVIRTMQILHAGYHPGS
jgi:hypothetical protein